MANNIVKVGIDVSDNGTSAKSTKNVEKLKDVLDQTQVSARRTGAAVGAMSAGSPSAAQARATQAQASQSYGVARGTVGTGAEGRDFAKQSQGLGGLVRLYATFAANLFAAEAAFRALSNAMDTSNMVRGMDQLGARSGVALGTLSKDLVKVTDGAVSMREAMEAVTKGTSAGLTSQQMLRLGESAKKASQALGLSMPDALSRLSRGIAKIEPELLDELGIFVKVDEAARKYALALGKPVSALTDFEKRQGFANAVLDQAQKKFSSIEVDANPYSKLSASLADLSQTGLSVVNTVLGPLIKLLSESPLALAAVIGLIGKTLLSQAIPALGQWRQGLQQQNAAALENIKTLQQQRAAYRNVIDEQVIQDLTSKNSIATQNSLAKAREISSNTQLATLKKLTAQVPTKAIGEQADIDNLKKLQTETAKYVRELEKRQKKDLDAGKAANVQRQFEIDKTRELIALLEQQAIAAQNIQKEEGKTPIKMGLAQKLFSKQEIDAAAAKAAEQRAIRTNILQNVGKTYDAAGFAEGWRQLNKEIAAGREGFKLVDGQVVKADASLTAFQAGLARTRGAIVLVTGVLGTLSAVVNQVFAAVATALIVFETLSFFFSRNEKEAEAASEALTRLSESVKTASNVIDEIARKDPLERMSTESIMARTTAFKNLTADMEALIQKTDKSVEAMGFFDMAVEGLKIPFGKDVFSKQAKAFAETITQSLKVAPEGKSKEEAKARLFKILGVNPEDLEALKDLAPNPYLYQKAIDQGLEPLGKSLSETAGKAQDLDEAFKKTSSTLDNLLVSALPTDQIGKLGQDFVNLGSKMIEAFKDPNTAADQLAKTVGDLSRLRFFSPQLQKDFAAQAQNIQSLVSEANTARTALTILKEEQAKLAQERTKPYAKLPFAAGKLDTQEQANREAQNIYEKRVKDAEGSIKSISDRFLKNSLELFSKGSQLINDSIAIGYQRATLTIRSALAQGLGDTLGGAREQAAIQKQQIQLDSAQLRITRSLIDSQEGLRLTMEESNLIELRKTLEEKGKKRKDTENLAAETKLLEDREKVLKYEQAFRDKNSQQLQQIIKAGAGVSTEQSKKSLGSFVPNIVPDLETQDKLLQAQAARSTMPAVQAKQALDAQLAAKAAETQAVNIGLYFKTIEKVAQIKKADLATDLDNLNTQKSILDLQTSAYPYLTDITLQKKLQLEYDTLANQQTQENVDLQAKIDKAEETRDKNKLGSEAQQNAIIALTELGRERERLDEKQQNQRQLQEAQQYKFQQDNIKKRLDAELAADKLVFDTKLAQDTRAQDKKQESLNFLKTLEAISPEAAIAEQASLDIAREEIRSQTELNKLKDESFTKQTAYNLELAALNEQLRATGSADPERREQLEAQIASTKQFYLDAITGELKLTELKTTNIGKLAEYNTQLEKQKQLQADINSLTGSLTALFGELGTALGGVASSIAAIANEDTLYLTRKKALQQELADSDDSDVKNKKIEELDKLDKKYAKTQLDNNLKVLNSSKKIFSEKTVAYKVIDAVEKAMHAQKIVREAIELAGQIKFYAIKLGLMQADTVASVTNSVTETAAETPNAVAKIYSSVDPITATAFVAGFLALMASLGAGGGGGSGVSVSQQRQETQGRGTVLGDDKAQSNSVRNSLELIAETSVEDLSFSNRMVELLQSIDRGIRGVTKGLYNVRGLRGEASAFGTIEGTVNKVNIPIIGSLFGSTSKTITDTGIIIKGFFSDLIEGTTGFLQQYEEITTRKKRLLRRTRVTVDTKLQNIDAENAAGLVDIFENAYELILNVGEKIGLQEQAIKSSLDRLQIDTGKFSLKGLSGQALEDALTALVNDILDKAAGAVFSSFEKYQQMGEGLLETVIRVVDSNDKINLALTSIGKNTLSISLGLNNFAGNLQMTSFDISEALVEAAGGLSNFLDQAKSFRDNFLTEAQQMAPIREAVTSEIARLMANIQTTTNTTQTSELTRLMQRLGIATLDTKEEFALLVQAVDLTTESGRELYQQLMNVAPTFAKLEDYEKKLADARLDQEMKILEMLKQTDRVKQLSRQRELAALDDSLKPAQMYIYALEDEAELRDKLVKARDKETAALEKTIKTLQDSIKTLKDYRNSLLTGSISTLTPEQKYQQTRQTALDLAAVAQGPATTPEAIAARDAALAKLPAATTAWLEASRISFASGAQYTQDFNSVLAILDNTSTSLAAQQTEAEKQLRKLEEQTSFLKSIDSNIGTVAELLPQYLTAIAATESLRNVDAGVIASLGTTTTAAAAPTTGTVTPIATTAPTNLTIQTNEQLAITINNLNTEITGLRTEIATLRTEQQAQSTRAVMATYDSSNLNAQQINDGLDRSFNYNNWRLRNRVDIL